MKQPKIDRLRFIHSTLERDGRLNLGQICKEFSVSKPQASLDIQAYRSICPGYIIYDASKKYYFMGDKFSEMPDLLAKKSLVHQSATVRVEDYNIVKASGRSHVEVYAAGVVALGLKGE